MTILTRTRQLVGELPDGASKTSLLGVIDAFEAGRFGRDDALLQLRLGTMGPAASGDSQKLNEIISSFETESKQG